MSGKLSLPSVTPLELIGAAQPPPVEDSPILLTGVNAKQPVLAMLKQAIGGGDIISRACTSPIVNRAAVSSAELRGTIEWRLPGSHNFRSPRPRYNESRHPE